MHDGGIVRKHGEEMNASLVRLFQLGELAVKRHARFTKVTSVSEREDQGALVCVPFVGGQAGELVDSFDLVWPQTWGEKTIFVKNLPDHHGQHDHRYIGRYLNFGLHDRSLPAFSKASLHCRLGDAGRAKPIAERNSKRIQSQETIRP